VNDTFDATQALQSWMIQASTAALEGLHPAQRALTFGSTWVRFPGVHGQVVEFGVVASMPSIEQAVEQGEALNMAEKQQARASIIRGLNAGYLFGWYYSRRIPFGELGVVHKGYVWPIPEHVHLAARAAHWQFENMAVAERINLEAARRAQLQHLRGRHV
jgi:hypothetical protein